jgi:hypothetical protein
MNIIRIATVSALAVAAAMQFAGPASADHRHRMRVLWPKIYAPEISGYIYRDEYDEDDDEGFFDPESEREYIQRHRRDRRVILDLYEDEFEEDLPPPKKVKKKPIVKKAAAKKPLQKRTTTTAAIVKPKTKPLAKPVAQSVASLEPKPGDASVPAKSILVPGAKAAVVQPKAPVSTATVKTNAPVAAKTQVASAAPAAGKVAAAPAGSIGCSKGAEIVSGYGFTSVKPRTCTGATYTFDAARGANGYQIKLSSASGEITDVQKLK